MAKKKIILFDSNLNYVGVPLTLLSSTKLLDFSVYDVRIMTHWSSLIGKKRI